MSGSKPRCKGKNRLDKPCGNFAVAGSDYCMWHSESEEERTQVEKFFYNHAKPILAFIAGGFAEAIVDDVYVEAKLALLEALQRGLFDFGTWNGDLSGDKEQESLADISQHYRQNRDFKSFRRLLPFLRIGMHRKDVEELLGFEMYEGSCGNAMTPCGYPTGLRWPDVHGEIMLHLHVVYASESFASQVKLQQARKDVEQAFPPGTVVQLLFRTQLFDAL